jgi:hypothetical protein
MYKTTFNVQTKVHEFYLTDLKVDTQQSTALGAVVPAHKKPQLIVQQCQHIRKHY